MIIHDNVSKFFLFKCQHYHVRLSCSVLYLFKFLFFMNSIEFIACHDEFDDACCINFSLLILYNLIL